MDIVTKIGDAFVKGGWAMYLILGASIFALAIIIERIIILYFRSGINKELFVREIQKYVLKGDVQKAVNLCSTYNVPLSRITKAGLLKVRGTDEDIQVALDEAALNEIPRLERRTGYLGMLSNVAVLMGLLGTIIGMIRCFGSVAASSAETRSTELAKGISEAMNCTAFGLLVSIPALIAFSIFNGHTQKLVDDIHEASVRILNLIVANRSKMGTDA